MKQLILILPDVESWPKNASTGNFDYNAVKKSIVSCISKRLMREVTEEEVKEMVTDVRIRHNRITLVIRL